MKHQIELRHLRYFLAVANELHFRKAAERLFISQPGLSRQIQQLEVALGVQLFERHNRKVLLTQAGTYLQEELSVHLQQLEKILEHTQLLHQGVEGSLKIGYVGSAMQEVIPKLLLNFKKKNDKVHVHLKEFDNKSQITALLQQQIDVGFVRQERVPSQLVTKALKEETFSLVLPKKHSLNTENFIDISQCKKEFFILFDASYSKSYYEKIMQIFDDAGFVPKVSHESVHASSIYQLVANGFGVSIVPTSLQFGYNMDVKFIELKNIKQRTSLKMVWNTKNTNPVLQEFIGS